MKISVSWGDFFLGCAVLTGIWYLVVGAKYYYQSIKDRLFKNPFKTIKSGTTEIDRPGVQQASLFQQPESLDRQDAKERAINTIVHEFVNELNALIALSATDQSSKDKLLPALRKLLSKYSSLANSPLRQDILNLIQMETGKHCHIHFSADELAQLW
ncbi:hypothetical protein [Foetidibacter luteolus]|uniref:hypothetical protein n=1 Tax=Foetidibacter luteolus TaxID=2608880 RepID=UPI00129B6B52|nr:hypothetical protein [Foetidibacter luteolus]